MESLLENNKVYVLVGEDVDDGILMLDWAIKKWSTTQSIIIVILYAANNNICKNYVYTPLGKLPVSSVSEKKLKDLEQFEEAKIEMVLAKYVAFCGKVKTEMIRIDKYEEPVQKIIVDLISGIRITKLVMSLKFMSPLSWKSRVAISGSFYVHRLKPDFCELFIICGGKLVFLREENNNNNNNQVVKRHSFRGFVGKMFNDVSANKKGKKTCDSPSSSSSSSSSSTLNASTHHQWEKYKQEIELYFSQLSSNEDTSGFELPNEPFQKLAMKLEISDTMTREEKIEVVRAKIEELQELIQQSRKEAKANLENRSKAVWAISLCTTRVVELGACINNEIAKQAELEKEFVSINEELHKLKIEAEEKSEMLSSTLQLRDDLSGKLHLLSEARSQAEIQLEKETREQAAIAQEIEMLRRERDVFLCWIEFSKERNAVMSSPRFDHRQFSSAEIRAATDEFSERLRLDLGGDRTRVYKGCLCSTLVAIKIYNSDDDFKAKIDLLSRISHPNILPMIGFCSELKSIVYEYMSNGCLRDTLFSTQRGSRRRRNRPLNWLERTRIASEVSRTLSFLHEAKPRPMIHSRLNPSRILLDRNNVAKISSLVDLKCHEASEMRSDIRGFGDLVLQLLTGRNWEGLVEEAIMMEQSELFRVLDHTAGEWPLDVAVELCGVAVKCLTIQGRDLTMGLISKEVDKVLKKGCEIARAREFAVAANEADDYCRDDVPSVFLCPILQDIMQNPYVAADGFSYELEAIEEWLRTGHETSPMTNLRLNDKILTPNYTLRSIIQDWQQKKTSILPSQEQQ